MTQSAHKTSPKDTLKMIFQSILGIVILLALLFLPAGRLDWWAAWGFIIVYISTVFIAVAVLQKKDPGLFQERRQTQENIKSWDKVITNLFGVVFIPLTLVIAGLDQRFGWTDSLPLLLQILAILLGVLGFVLVFWGMAANTYFSSYVRIQDDRGHTTITAGPYRYVRHPGYLGMIVSALMIPLVLASWWALIPAGIGAALVILRTALEDQTLQEELEGYKEFTQRTRYRLIPGIW
jgi:protein-S-isoprenylcysteine O-methyltransferase Ste14